MPVDYELTEYQQWGVGMLLGFFGVLYNGQLTGFLNADDLASFVRQIREGGPFGGEIPEGRPGSKFPGTGLTDPLDIARDLFRSLLSGLGETDGSGGVDPATRPDSEPVGTFTISRADGSVSTFTREEDGRTWVKTIDAKGNEISIMVTPDRDGTGGPTVVVETHSRDGQETRKSFRYSPGVDGAGDGNSDLNPLSGINVVGPQSNEQAISALQHPGKDPNELDPNSGIRGFSLSETEQERLGLIVPALDVLDLNSGMDPLSQLNLDPNQIHTRSEDDDRIDPNTGLTAFPVRGGSFGSLVTNTDTKTNDET